jgi:HEPN domain-containing protein
MLKHKDAANPATVGYIDLLIVVSCKNSVPFTELEPILEMPYVKDQLVSCSLHSEGNVLEGLRNGHIFYSLNCIPENLVYDDKTTNYPATTPEALQEVKKHVKEKFTQAFEKSQHFYESAVSLYQSHPSQIIVFMLHQAAELTYRGILQSLNGYDKKTHEIRAFKKHVRRCAPSINTVFPDNTEEEKRLLDILENAYLSARYKDYYEVCENDLSLLFKKLTQLQTAANEVIKEKLNN